MKSILGSKRFWAGLLGLLTSVSLIFTGEKSLVEQAPFILTGLISLIQTIIGLTSTQMINLGFGKYSWAGRKENK